MLPRIVPSSGVVGEAEIGGARVPLAGLAGDQQAALFGQACFGPGDAKATYGTGSFVLANQGERGGPPPHGILRTAAAQPGVTALEGAVFVTGAAVQWLRDGLGIIADAAETEALARSVESTGGVHFVPALTGPRLAALGCRRARADLGPDARHGAGRDRPRGARGDRLPDRRRRRGHGAARCRRSGPTAARPENAWLMQFQADILGMPVEVAGDSEMTALGAAALAGLAVGVWSGLDEVAAAWHLGARYEPAMSRDEAAERLAGWHAAVERARARLR